MALLQDGAKSSVILQGTSSAESDFIFKEGVFYATFEGHNHPRKEASELHAHLTYVPPPPAINENGKRTWLQPQETYVNYPAHFYAAQLVHYGIKPLKTKSAAKKKLLYAFSGPDGKTLEVPKSILELEKAMRRQSLSNPAPMEVDQKVSVPNIQKQHNKDTPELYKSEPAIASAFKAPRTKQTARKTTRPTVPLSTMVTSQPSNPEPVMSKPTLTDLASSSNRAPRTKQTAIKTNWPGTIPGTIMFDLSPAAYTNTVASTSTRGRRTKQTARKSTGRNPPKSSGFLEPRAAVKRFEKSLVPEKAPQMTDAEIRDGIKNLSAVRARQILELLFDKIPAVVDTLDAELSSGKKNGQSSKVKEKPVNPSVWMGMYDIDAPAVEDLYGDGHYSFGIYPSSTSKHLWASFNFGGFTGVMRSIYPVPNFLNTEIHFEWRGDIDQSGMTFDDDNRAVITFLPGGLLRGKMSAPIYGTYWFYGCRPSRGVETTTRKQQLGKVSSWKSTWRNINSHNYDVARRARWGRSGGEQKEEKAFESDTTDGKQKRTSKIDLKNFMKEPSSDNESYGDDDEEEDEYYGW